jgi:hypothetical protein
MEEYLAEKEEYRGHTIKIYQDTSPESPRKWDNMGKMVCFHKRYDLGDRHDYKSNDFEGWDGLENYLIKECKAVIVIPLYLYDHSGLTMRTYPFSCPWDSGQVGFIYADRETILKNFAAKRLTAFVLQKAREMLETEVKDYDKFLSGDVFGFVIEDADSNTIDSCWGYYNDPSEIVSQCKLEIDSMILAESSLYPKIDVYVENNAFKARIRESIVEPTYEIIIGGEEWQKGKGKKHWQKIEQTASEIIKALKEEHGKLLNNGEVK